MLASEAKVRVSFTCVIRDMWFEICINLIKQYYTARFLFDGINCLIRAEVILNLVVMNLTYNIGGSVNFMFLLK